MSGVIEFFTGFQGCGQDSDIQAFFNNTYSSTVPRYSSTNGWDNGKCIRSGSGNCTFRRDVPPGKTKAAGLHVKGLTPRTYSSTLLYNCILRFVGPGITLYNVSTGLEVYRTSTKIAELPGTILSGDLQHLEVKCFSHASAGTFEIKLNGILLAGWSGLNTGGSDITGVLFGCTQSGDVFYDNIYIATDWVGELKSALLLPAADHAVAFTPSAGSDNYAMVNQAAQDGDTTYVYSDNPGGEDLYEFSDLPPGLIPLAATVVMVARKDDVDARALQMRAEQGGIGYDVGSQFGLSTTYPSGVLEGQFVTLTQSPGGAAWDRDILNGIKWGFKVSV
jgi:hypothetical protein